MFHIQHQNLYKLFTHEDNFNIHKTLGFISLTHFAVRFYNLFMHGDMLFTDSFVDKTLLLFHLLLSWSSLIFVIPTNRVKSAIVIWPEFRAHSILFATRSLACIFFYYIMNDIYRVRVASGLVVMWTMVMADMITECYKMEKTTMRGMSWPNFFPMNNPYYQDAHNFFYSFSQIGATLSMFMGKYPDHPFMVLLPIQIAPFLSTLVKKGIISDFHWHLVYTFSLSLPYLYGSVANDKSTISIYLMVVIAILRFYLCVDKYLLWYIAMIFFFMW